MDRPGNAHAPAPLLELADRRLVSVIRAATPEAALAAAHAVADGGVAMVEITFTVPEAARVMAEVAKRTEVTMGAGTVLRPEQAEAALAAGARFVIAPNFSPAVARVALAAGVMYCPGAYTTGEILAARDAGAHVVKVYPVGVAGGPDYIRIIRDPLPDIPMLAAGGTNLDNLVPFLEAGCVGVGLGGSLADPRLAAAGDFAEITRRARAFTARLEQHRRAVAAMAARA
jgi:2-dehydro-3-deoxyphosphogluconate aldolase/(4S)-4-hydroxy-2-oxoglutarate aldolase